MKKAAFIFIVFTLVSLGCKEKNPSEAHSAKEQSQGKYPKEIDSLGLQHLYDETKWNFYCLYGPDSLYNIDKNGKHMSFGMLDMTFDGALLKEDTTLLLLQFDYVNKDTLKEDQLVPNYSKYHYYGIYYVGNSDTIVGYEGRTFRGRDFLEIQDSNNKYKYPLQPDVVKYIKDNKDRIHPWFRNEAVKRGIIKETTVTE